MANKQKTDQDSSLIPEIHFIPLVKSIHSGFFTDHFITFIIDPQKINSLSCRDKETTGHQLSTPNQLTGQGKQSDIIIGFRKIDINTGSSSIVTKPIGFDDLLIDCCVFFRGIYRQ